MNYLILLLMVVIIMWILWCILAIYNETKELASKLENISDAIAELQKKSKHF